MLRCWLPVRCRDASSRLYCLISSPRLLRLATGACPTRAATSLGSRSCLIGAPHARLPISSRLPPAVVLGDEESLGIYREDEAYTATRFPCPCDLQRPLDGRGGDPGPARECTLTGLDGHAYHLRASPLFRSAGRLPKGAAEVLSNQRASLVIFIHLDERIAPNPHHA